MSVSRHETLVTKFAIIALLFPVMTVGFMYICSLPLVVLISVSETVLEIQWLNVFCFMVYGVGMFLGAVGSVRICREMWPRRPLH